MFLFFTRLSRVVGPRLRGWRLPLVVLLLVFLTSWPAMALVEGGDSDIAAPGNYWWYFVVTAATVGYGDLFPVSTGGRLVGQHDDHVEVGPLGGHAPAGRPRQHETQETVAVRGENAYRRDGQRDAQCLGCRSPALLLDGRIRPDGHAGMALRGNHPPAGHPARGRLTPGPAPGVGPS